MNAINNATIAIASAPSFIPEMHDKTSTSPSHKISTQRLCLRPVDESDLVDYIELFTDPAVMRFVGLEAGYIPSYKEIEILHRSAVQAWKTRGYGRWSMFEAATNTFVGFCGFRSEEGQPELICALHEKFWGSGLAAEASRACLRYGFECFGFEEVKAFSRPEHRRARRVMDKLNAQFLSYVNFHGVEGAAYLFRQDSIEYSAEV